MAVGAFSVNCYAMPRSTQDADFVVQLGTTDPRAIVQQLGPDYKLDAQMSFETITATTRHLLTHRDSEFKIELFHLSDDPHDQSRFARRAQRNIGCRPVFVPTVEDVIITKLRWSRQGRRSKDIDDVENILAVQSPQSLDWNYLHHWCNQHGTRQLLDDLRQALPPL